MHSNEKGFYPNVYGLSTLTGAVEGRPAGFTADSSSRRLSGQGVHSGILSRQRSPAEPESSGGRDGMVSLSHKV